MDSDLAIEARDLTINYRRYMKKATTLKDAVVSLFQGSHFQTFTALKNFNIRLKKGGRLGVLGPNGSGKSTLLKAIAGVLPPTEGSIETQGRISPLLELGAGFKLELTGRENVFLNGAIMGLSTQDMEDRLESIVAFADIGDFIDAPLSTYSSGMKARLGFAVATDVDPDILLLDEILAVGDAAFKRKAAQRMEKLLESGRTVVLVTHSMERLKDMCEHAMYLRQGETVCEGSPEEVVQRYLADSEKAS